ncbi:hypothetical protein GCM10010406_24960 [Streptomyces thermolineatus]|uniref:Uncharacterized protein n=1 Tax=Streptomyces thermolineatus TaxID=44033 RepID=A0ABN3LRN0_9ACTN
MEPRSEILKKRSSPFLGGIFAGCLESTVAVAEVDMGFLGGAGDGSPDGNSTSDRLQRLFSAACGVDPDRFSMNTPKAFLLSPRVDGIGLPARATAGRTGGGRTL